MAKRKKTHKKNAKSKKQGDDQYVIYPSDFIRPMGKKKSTKIKDIPFSKYKSKGTRATLGNMDFNYQEYRNIRIFFYHLNKELNLSLNYNNESLNIVARDKSLTIEGNIELKSEKRYNIIIINLNTIDGNHANIALIDNSRKIIEYYEPHGYRKNKNSEIAGFKGIYGKKINLIKKYFKDFLPLYSFLDVVSMNKKTSFQTELDPEEHSGFCVTWCILFIHYRLLNRDILLSRLIKHIDKTMNTTKLLKYAKYIEETIKHKFDLK